MTGCQTCTSSTLCTSCTNNYYLQGNACILCANTISKCSICTNSNTCTSCIS